MRVSSIPASSAASGAAVTAISLPVGIGDSAVLQPRRAPRPGSPAFRRREGLGRDDHQRRRRIERAHRIVERRAVDVRQEAHVELRRSPAERVDQQRRAEHRAADADVKDAGDVAERARLDRIDQRAHPLPPGGRKVDVVRRAAAALGDMRRRPAFARVDDLARETARRAPRRSPFRSARATNAVDQRLVEVRLRPVEIESRRRRSVSRLSRSGSSREQLVEPSSRRA